MRALVVGTCSFLAALVAARRRPRTQRASKRPARLAVRPPEPAVRRVGLGAALLTLVAGSACAPPLPTALTIRFHYSHFEPDLVRVRAGVPVTITLRNDDPIDHEWIVGPPAIHAVHRRGTEAVHERRPTEVSVPALSSRVTRLTFSRAGDLAYSCHLPGHEEYGMVGTLHIS
jgi:uncharacterized cupredoxin-like copper-binding protein